MIGKHLVALVALLALIAVAAVAAVTDGTSNTRVGASTSPIPITKVIDKSTSVL